MSKLYPNLSKLDKARLELFARIPHCAPDFYPGVWDGIDSLDWTRVRAKNTCYAYAANDPETRRLASLCQVPAIGINANQALDVSREEINHRKFKDSISRDGMIFAGRKKPSEPPPGCFAVAVFSCGVYESIRLQSYHFYRLDRDGYWSHKCGLLPVYGHHRLGKPIKDPRTHARHESPYQNMRFIGYFYVPNSGIALGRRESILPAQTSDPAKRRTSLQQPDRVQFEIRARLVRENEAR